MAIAERIARAFIDQYHERPGVFDELEAEGAGPYQNSMRGGIAVMMELGIYEGGENEQLAKSSDS